MAETVNFVIQRPEPSASDVSFKPAPYTDFSSHLMPTRFFHLWKPKTSSVSSRPPPAPQSISALPPNPCVRNPATGQVTRHAGPWLIPPYTFLLIFHVTGSDGVFAGTRKPCLACPVAHASSCSSLRPGLCPPAMFLASDLRGSTPTPSFLGVDPYLSEPFPGHPVKNFSPSPANASYSSCLLSSFSHPLSSIPKRIICFIHLVYFQPPH